MNERNTGSGFKHRAPLAAGVKFATIVLLTVLAQGVLFQPPGVPIPTVGSKLKDGTELRIIEVLEPGVIHYETT